MEVFVSLAILLYFCFTLSKESWCMLHNVVENGFMVILKYV